MKSTYDYKRLIKANDRATLLNLMIGLNAYTLCSGIICAELNGGDYTAVPLDREETMTIGYIKRKGIPLSRMGRLYVEELGKYGIPLRRRILLIRLWEGEAVLVLGVRLVCS